MDPQRRVTASDSMPVTAYMCDTYGTERRSVVRDYSALREAKKIGINLLRLGGTILGKDDTLEDNAGEFRVKHGNGRTIIACGTKMIYCFVKLLHP